MMPRFCACQGAEGAGELNDPSEAAGMLRSASLGEKLGDSVGPTHDDPPLSMSVGAHRSQLCARAMSDAGQSRDWNLWKRPLFPPIGQMACRGATGHRFIGQVPIRRVLKQG